MTPEVEDRVRRLERVWLVALLLFAAVTIAHIYTLHWMLRVIRSLLV